MKAKKKQDQKIAWSALLLSVVLGVGLSIVTQKIRTYYQVKNTPSIIGKCFRYNAPRIQVEYFEKVIKYSKNGRYVVTKYTFVGKDFPEFKNHWACLKGVGCDETEISHYLSGMEETKCPW